MMKNNFIIVLRWVGVLPFAVASYLIGYAFYKLIFALQIWLDFGGNADSFLNKYFFAAFAAGIGGFLFVTFPSMLAPTGKKYVSLILLILLAMFMGIAVFAGILQEHALGILEGVASVVGAVIAYIQILEPDKV